MNTKLIFKICTLSLFGLLIYSCDSSDDELANETFGTTPKEIRVGFSDTNNNSVANESDSQIFTVTLTEPLSFDANVSFEISSSDGTVAEVIGFEQQRLLPAGSTSLSFSLTYADDNIDYEVETYTIRIVNLLPADGSSIQSALGLNNYLALNNENNRNIRVESPVVITTTAGALTIKLGWNSGEDFELFLRRGAGDVNGTIVSSAVTVANPETVILPANAADGDYSLRMEAFCGFFGCAEYGNPTIYNFNVTHPSGNNFQFPAGEIFEDNFIFSINKSTSGSNVTFKLTPL